MYKCIYKMILFLPVKLIIKIICMTLFPIAYIFRNHVWKAPEADNGIWDLKDVKKKNKGIKLLIWFFLDDSIWSETGKEYDTKRKNIYWLTHNDFLNAWYWCGFRNSCNNLNHYISKGKFVSVLYRYKSKKVLYECRQFEKGKYPYIEFCLFGKRFNVGWLHSGKFEGPKIEADKC